MRNDRNLQGMRRFGIRGKNMLGIPIPVLRKLAKKSGKSHALALSLWKSGIHEARILAAYVDEPKKVTSAQMDSWAAGFDSWDVCDQVCQNLFDRTTFAYQKALTWSFRKEEFVKRAGFALMACLAWHDKRATNSAFDPFFKRIVAESTDDRNFVKKAVNWALRQIGKRNPILRRKAIFSAQVILSKNTQSPAARFVAKNALRELAPIAIGGRKVRRGWETRGPQHPVEIASIAYEDKKP